MKRKIVFYIGSLAKGGAERVFVNLAQYFKGLGYEVVIATKLVEKVEYEVPEGVVRIVVDIAGEEISKSRIVNFFRRLSKLRRTWKREKPDLVFTAIGKNNFMVIVSSLFMRHKVIGSVVSDPKREYWNFVMRFLAKTLFFLADGMVFQTEDAKSYFPKGIQKKSIILPNSINPAFIKERFEGTRKKEIVMVGRIDDNKNPQMLVEAFSYLAKEYPEWNVILYGDGVGREKVERLIEEKSMGSRIVMAGSQGDIQDKIYESSVYVLCSYVEGMPNALMEAMALGLAVISTDCPCGGPRMLIENYQNGILIPVGDSRRLQEALREVLDNEELRENMGRNASLLGSRLHPDKVNLMWKEYFESIM